MQSITLPMPPSLNMYYRHVGKMVMISAEGRAYRKAVRLAAMEQMIESVGKSRVFMHVLAERADERRADLDNLLKCLGDSLERDDKDGWAGAYDNDGQIDLLVVERGEKSKGAPRVTVTIGVLPGKSWMGRVLAAIRSVVYPRPVLARSDGHEVLAA